MSPDRPFLHARDREQLLVEASTCRTRVLTAANESANGSDENPSARADTAQHEPDRRVTFVLLRPHDSSSDITGRTALLTLSRWRHGFESRTGCQGASWASGRLSQYSLTQLALYDTVAPVSDRVLAHRVAVHAALGDPIRLAIVDELVVSDRSPVELRRLTRIESNLLAHHLDVLAGAGLISRRPSSGDGRRRYVHLERTALAGIVPGSRLTPQRVLFVCTHNSARSQLAVALWSSMTDRSADSAGTHPAPRVHPRAVDAARRAGLNLSGVTPRLLTDEDLVDRLVITVCDRAHEELEPPPSWLHWSIADPVAKPTKAAFDSTVVELRTRISSLLEVAS